MQEVRGLEPPVAGAEGCRGKGFGTTRSRSRRIQEVRRLEPPVAGAGGRSSKRSSWQTYGKKGYLLGSDCTDS